MIICPVSIVGSRENGTNSSYLEVIE